MLRKSAVVSLIGLFVLTLGATVAARADSKREIDVSVAETLQRFTNANPAHSELLRKAAGVLVFPRITKAGAGIGGEHGEGALHKGGTTVNYYSLTSASLGLTLGAGQRSQILLFINREALAKFQVGNSFQVGVDAQVALVSQGAGGAYASETLMYPFLGFVFA